MERSIERAEISDLVAAQPAPVDQNPALVYLTGLSTATGRRTMRAALDTIAGILAPGETCETLRWSAVRFQHTAAIRTRLAQTYAPATVNKMLSALRGVLRAAWQLGQMSAEDHHRASAVKGVRGSTLPAGRDLSDGEILALATVCERDPTPAGPRDALILGLLAGGGLRRAEAVALDLAHVDPDAGRLMVRGKGNKERSVYLASGMQAALDDWLGYRGERPGPLLCPVSRSGRVTVARLSSQTIYDVLKKRARQAGVKAFSPHDLRRTFVGNLLDAGADISTVAQMAGHENVQTTMRYDRRPEETKRKAAGLLHIPYRRKGDRD